jgi:undecaprenyl-diphosphatase
MSTAVTQLPSRLQRLADRFRAFEPHTITRLFKLSLALLCAALFLALAASIPALQAWDDQILLSVENHLRSPEWHFLVMDLSSLGSLAVVITLCVVSGILLLVNRDPAATIHLVIVAIGAIKIAGWAKHWIDRPRPQIIPRLIQVGGLSFPSGHAVTASAMYLTLAILASRHLRRPAQRVALFGIAALLILTVGFSRIYLGVHHPSDVMSGTLLGAAWALFMGALFSKQHFGASQA